MTKTISGDEFTTRTSADAHCRIHGILREGQVGLIFDDDDSISYFDSYCVLCNGGSVDQELVDDDQSAKCPRCGGSLYDGVCGEDCKEFKGDHVLAAEDLSKVQFVMNRLYREDRLGGDEMRDLASKLDLALKNAVPDG